MKALALGLALALLCGCGPAPDARPNVLLVVFDTTRADDWSILDPERAITPNLDALAARGHRFSRAHSLYSVTVPSHVSLFTGRSVEAARRDGAASASGASDAARDGDRFGYSRASLFTILKQNGYRSYAVASNRSLRKRTVRALENVDVEARPRDEAESADYYRRVSADLGIEVPVEGEDPAGSERALRNRRILAPNAEYIGREALRIIDDHRREHADQPFFLFINYNDAHDPYLPESPWHERFPSPRGSVFQGDLWDPSQRRTNVGKRGRLLAMSADGLSPGDIERARALHLGSLAYADHHFGRLVAALRQRGLMDDGIIVATSDHGEAFGEGGRMGHGGWGNRRVSEALLHVPLFMRLPDAGLTNSIHDEPVDLRDIKPTILDYLGITDDDSTGRSLLPLIRGSSLPPADLRPRETSLESLGDNRIGGQDAKTQRELEKELRALGYIE